MRNILEQFITKEMSRLEKSGLRRSLKETKSVGVRTIINGRDCLSFATNDYLGLANSTLLKKAATLTAKKYGTGSASSRLVSGTLPIHIELEDACAKLKHRERACLFPCGYMANVGAISSLVGKEDAIVSDESNHASIIDGCRLSGAKIFVYPHRNMNALETTIKSARKKFRKVLVVTESVFSVEGGIAPLNMITKIAKENGAVTMLDDAHATGVIGINGRGGEELFNIEGNFDVVMGAFGKALGSQGGFITGSKQLIEYVINTARTFIYTTALAPPIAGAALAAIGAIRDEPERRARLYANIRLINTLLIENGLTDKLSFTPIIPIRVGNEKRVMEIQKKLFLNGIFVAALRYPTVPKGKAALRISLSSLHSPSDIERLVESLSKEIKHLR